jgi:hypothetical protein
MTTKGYGGHARSGVWHRGAFAVLFGALIALAPRAEAAPRMISYGYNSCVSCHASVQGRGLLNSYGRGIDSAQSYSTEDLTAKFLGHANDGAAGQESWNGRFGNVLADGVISSRVTERFDTENPDPALAALYRQILFLDEKDDLRLNTEVGYLKNGLSETPLGSHLAATGGDDFHLRKLVFEWRIESGDTTGKELVLGRDYLPLGLQIEDHTAYIQHLNRGGIYDFPLQLKYFTWDEKSLASIYVHAPSFEEPSDRQEYGGGFLYERYPTRNLTIGTQGLIGFSDEADRLKIGPYVRWGISEKWALLAQADYTAFRDVGAGTGQGSQLTTYLQLFHHHTEWLVSSVAANYAYSDSIRAEDELSSLRYSLTARLNRNLTAGITYASGDILRDLGDARELATFVTLKF